MDKTEFEQTLVLIKPDALKISMTGYILSQLSEYHSGLRFAGAKVVHVSRMLAEEHYAEHKGKAFFPALIEYLTGAAHYPDEPWRRRVIAIVYQGIKGISKVRDITGPTNPHMARDQKPGSLRSLGTIVPLKDDEGRLIGERMDNLVHASANPEEAEREIKLWFKPNDIPPAMRAFETCRCNEHYYYKEGRLFKKYEPGTICLLAPGDTVWASDLEALEKGSENKESAVSVDNVAVKYLINEISE